MPVELKMISDTKELRRDLARVEKLLDKQTLKLKAVDKSARQAKTGFKSLASGARGAKNEVGALATIGKSLKSAFGFIGITAGVVKLTAALRGVVEEAQRGLETLRGGADAEKLVASVATDPKDRERLRANVTAIRRDTGLTKLKASQLVQTARSSSALTDADAFKAAVLDPFSQDVDAILKGAGALGAAFEGKAGSAAVRINKLLVAGELGGGVVAEDIAKGAGVAAASFKQAGFSDEELLAGLSSISEQLGSETAATSLKAFATVVKRQEMKGNFFQVMGQLIRLQEEDDKAFTKTFGANVRFTQGFEELKANRADVLKKFQAITAQEQLTGTGKGAAALKIAIAKQDPVMQALVLDQRAIQFERTRLETVALEKAKVEFERQLVKDKVTVKGRPFQSAIGRQIESGTITLKETLGVPAESMRQPIFPAEELFTPPAKGLKPGFLGQIVADFGRLSVVGFKGFLEGGGLSPKSNQGVRSLAVPDRNSSSSPFKAPEGAFDLPRPDVSKGPGLSDFTSLFSAIPDALERLIGVAKKTEENTRPNAGGGGNVRIPARNAGIEQ